jgi:hypothetical protein
MMRLLHLLGMMGVGSVGAWAAYGSDDFSVTVHRSLPETYAAFSAVHTFGGELRKYGVHRAKVTISRPSDREIVFTIPSSAEAEGSRIAFALSPAANGATLVSAAIDVPPVPMTHEGRNLVLSEAKVEAHFREAIENMARRLDAGQPVEASQQQLSKMLDMVAIASNPEDAAVIRARIEHLDQVSKRLAQEKSRFGPDQVERGYAEGYDPIGIDDPDSGYPEEFR